MRRAATHHGIDTGDGTVIHYYKNQVRIDSMYFFTGGDELIETVSYKETEEAQQRALERAIKRLGKSSFPALLLIRRIAMMNVIIIKDLLSSSH